MTLELWDICAKNHQGNAYSVAANPRQKDKAEARRRILGALRALGEASCETLETYLSLSHQTCSARLSELKRDHSVSVVGETRNKSGRKASVYTVSVN